MTAHMGLNFKIAFFLLLLSHYGSAFDILAIVSLPLGSHYMSFRNLFRELAAKGHNVTVINNFPDKNPPHNLRFIDLKTPHKPTHHSLESYEIVDSTYGHLINTYQHVSHGSVITKEDCENLLTSESMKVHFADDRKYDLIFVEQFMSSDCGLAYALALYDAPIIGIASHVLVPFVYGRLGLPFDIAADAFYFSNGGPTPTLLQKVETALVMMFMNSFGHWYIHKQIYGVFNRYLPNHSLDIERDAKARMKMVFSNQHFSLTGARLLAPQLLEIGGIHIVDPKPVPKDVEQFLSDASNGAIYVSFGTNLQASSMSQRKRQEFLTAFMRLPFKVIWKYENATFAQENLYTGNWFPQIDVLCHPKVIAFVSHGGMLSLAESTHCGKPLITIPFFGDQFSNAAAARAVGIGKTLFFDRLNADNLENTIRELTSPEMQQNAQRISRLWHDRPMKVMDSAIYWTEYVARHKTAPPSLPATLNTWFDSLLIDVAFIILILISCVGLAVYTLCKLLIYLCVYVLDLLQFVCIKITNLNENEKKKL